MPSARREILVERYHVLHVHDCPIELVHAATNLVSGMFVVENIRPIRSNDWDAFTTQLDHDIAPSNLNVRNFSLDVQMDRSQFSLYTELWNRTGVYAVAISTPIPFRATDLDPIPRFKALDNFDWSLEISIPGPSGPDWGTFTSPDANLIETLAAMA